MTLNEVMQQYKNIKTKYVTVQSQFEQFKRVFEKDFNDEIMSIERQQIERSQQEALRQAQLERQPKPTKDKPIGGNIEVSLRELPKEQESKPKPKPEPMPQPSRPKAKMTRKKQADTAPETAVAAKPPKLNGYLSKLYRKLCKKFHPDICGSDEQFIKLQQTYEGGDNMELIEIAVDQDMNVDEYIENKEQMIEYWKQEIIRIDKEIYNMTHMLPWVWCMADPERKKELRPNMIKYLQVNS